MRLLCSCENKENSPLEGWDQRLVSITFQMITPALGYLRTLSALPFNSSRLFQVVRANLSWHWQTTLPTTARTFLDGTAMNLKTYYIYSTVIPEISPFFYKNIYTAGEILLNVVIPSLFKHVTQWESLQPVFPGTCVANNWQFYQLIWTFLKAKHFCFHQNKHSHKGTCINTR